MTIQPPVIEIPNLRTPDECSEEIRRSNALGFEDQAFRGEERTEIRSRVSIDDVSAAGALWLKLAGKLPPLSRFYVDGLKPDPYVADLSAFAPVGVNQRLRYYKYSGGQRFAPHVDLAHSDGPQRSFLTVIIYLNDDFEGGETDFFGRSVVPRQGSAIVFPHELQHQGRPVFVGIKYVLRTDVMYRAG